MIIREESALSIRTGDELLRFDEGDVEIQGSKYIVLTGWEIFDNACWWCGEKIKQGKRISHYCRKQSHHDFESCFRQYWKHFEWGSASAWAKQKAGAECENCGKDNALEVHHIVPIKGQARFFSVYNLPWNLVVLCHTCHWELHRIMSNANRKPIPTGWDLAKQKGQLLMALEGVI